MWGGMYGYCGGSKFGLHQLPIKKKYVNRRPTVNARVVGMKKKYLIILVSRKLASTPGPHYLSTLLYAEYFFRLHAVTSIAG